MQSSLSQPSMVLSGTAIHNFPAVQHQELAKAQSGLAFQQTSNTQPIPILYEHQLGQASGLGGSQLIDTHLLQVRQELESHTVFVFLFSKLFKKEFWKKKNVKSHNEKTRSSFLSNANQILWDYFEVVTFDTWIGKYFNLTSYKIFSRLERILPRLQIFILDKYNSLVRQIFITLPSHQVLSSR